MPLTFTLEKSPAGHSFVRTVTSGTVTAEDSSGLIKVLSPGQQAYGMPLLCLVERGTDLTPEARKAFTIRGDVDGSDKKSVAAVVVSSAALRVLISFVVRIAGSADSTKFFATEDEAKRWLFSLLDA